MTFPRRARLAALTLGAVALTGCSAINPITTQFDYAASDGAQVAVGDVFAHNLLAITAAEGEPVMLSGSVSNGGGEDVTLDISLDGTTSTQVAVPAGGTVFLGSGEGQALVTATATAQPGLLTTVVFVSEAEGSITRQIPTVDGTLSEYAALLEDIPAAG